MQGAKRRVVIGALAGSLLVGAAAAAPASGAIKVTRDSRNNVLAKFEEVKCEFKNGKPVGFQAIGRAGGWGIRSTIYTARMKRDKVYHVSYGDDSTADVFVFPPKGPAFGNDNKPQPGGTDPGFSEAGGVGLTKKGGGPKGDRFFVGLPKIYNGEGSNPKYVTVSGFADCK
jgi:hypothetical protein